MRRWRSRPTGSYRGPQPNGWWSLKFNVTEDGVTPLPAEVDSHGCATVRFHPVAKGAGHDSERLLEESGNPATPLNERVCGVTVTVETGKVTSQCPDVTLENPTEVHAPIIS